MFFMEAVSSSDPHLPQNYFRNILSTFHKQINNKLKEAHQQPLMPLTVYHKQRRATYLCMLINRGTDEPGTGITLDPHTLQPIDHGTKRVGHPRKNWYKRQYKTYGRKQ